MKLEYHTLQIPIPYALYVKLKTKSLESGMGIRQLLSPEIEQFKSNLVNLVTPVQIQTPETYTSDDRLLSM